MLWIATQMWFLLIASFAIGLGVGWWAFAGTARPAAPAAAAPPPAERAPEPEPPATFRFREGGRKEDLTQIIGLDAETSERLNRIGVFSLAQIAGWSPANIAWIEERLDIGERIHHEHWVEQARTILAERGEQPLR